jgi:protein gp37
MEDTKIRWATDTWNPMTGCTKVSTGCDNCYAEKIALKFGAPAFPHGFEPTFKPQKIKVPAKWKEPRRIFVNSMSDVFHTDFTFEQIDQVFDEMLEHDRHQYLVLTKRPKRMAAYAITHLFPRLGIEKIPDHIWIGTSIESNDFVWRADALRRIPAGIRFISAEPLLGPLPDLDLDGIHWLIVGGESGPNYRPMDHEWARELRDRSVQAGIAFFFKQSAAYRTEIGIELDGERWEQYPADL